MVNTRSTVHFYSQLDSTHEFSVLKDPQHFIPAPDQWSVVIADVVNSTQAVKRGAYKEVNLIGASCVTAVLNVSNGIDIPFVFGGDGATLLIPNELKDQITQALIQTRALSKAEFDIDLRIGMVPIQVIREQGKDVLVNRFELSPGNALAMFSGGGVELADKLIKQDVDCRQYTIAVSGAENPPDLTGLSCRWQPLASQHGQMVCLLIQVLNEDLAVRHQQFGDVLSGLSQILGQDLRPPTPVTQKTLRFNWPMRGLILEAKLTKGRQSFLRRYAFLLYQSFIQLILERFDLSAGGYNAPVYRNEIQSNTDYRRFDDVLRLVLDCSDAQITTMRNYLDELHQAGRVAYGMHCTDQAQMTCLVFSLEQSEHVHFVDGTEGGFWAAAVGYKKQLAQLKANEAKD